MKSEFMKYAFVVLHYKSTDDTIKCVNSILRISNDNSEIIIVDNASKDNSVKYLRQRYNKNPNIHIIKNKENLGFAKGNNVGYRYARNKLKAKFVLICNNDLIFDQENFMAQLKRTYDKYSPYIIGPDIESLTDHGHQSPMKKMSEKPFEINFLILKYITLLVLSKLSIYDLLKRKSKNNKQKITNNYCYNRVSRNVILHGAMLIFTPNFVSKENNAFRPETFLYMEENILYIYAKRKNYSMLYTPKLHVFHKEDSSTNSLFTNNKDKREFVFKNLIRSLLIYKKYLIRQSPMIK